MIATKDVGYLHLLIEQLHYLEAYVKDLERDVKC